MAVTINTFFLLISLLLVAIFVLFKPMDIETYDNNDTAMLELKAFQLYDIGSEGLRMMLQGSFGKRYRDCYEVYDINYSSKTDHEQQHMAAKAAVYRNHILYLSGDVVYKKGEDFVFRSDEAQYDENHHTAMTIGAFELKNNEGVFKGYELQYNSEADTIRAKTVSALYYISKAN